MNFLFFPGLISTLYYVYDCHGFDIERSSIFSQYNIKVFPIMDLDIICNCELISNTKKQLCSQKLKLVVYCIN
jgi:hypothetical protein